MVLGWKIFILVFIVLKFSSPPLPFENPAYGTGPGLLVVIIIVNYCFASVMLYTKMLKKAEKKLKEAETVGFFVIGDISVGGGPPPLATPMV